MQLVDLADMKQPPRLVVAHETPLACIAINKEGTLIATASEKVPPAAAAANGAGHAGAGVRDGVGPQGA